MLAFFYHLWESFLDTWPRYHKMAPTYHNIQYMEAHLNNSRVSSIWIFSFICLPAASIAVIRRYVARKTLRQGLGRNDHSLFMGYLSHIFISHELVYARSLTFFRQMLFVCCIVAICTGTKYGLGRHVLLLTNPTAVPIVSLNLESSTQA